MDSLKEDAHVDVQTAMTPTQLLLIWTLMGLLLTWMILFALLALRPELNRKADFEDLSASTGSFPQLHVIVNQQAEKQAIRLEESAIEVQVTPAAKR
jgi:hypothetical protein